MILTPALWLPPEKPAIIRPADKRAIFPMPFFIKVRVTTALSFLQGAVSGADLTTYTFASQNLGTADSNRWVIVCVAASATVSRSISTVTVGGVSATKLVQSEATNNYRHTSIWAANVPSGTTGDIVVTWSAGVDRCGYSAYRLITSTNPTTTLFDSETDISLTGSALSVSIDRASGGIIVAMATFIGSGSNSCTWTGATEDYDANWSEVTSQILTSASATTGASPVTVTATSDTTPSSGNCAMCAASFA